MAYARWLCGLAPWLILAASQAAEPGGALPAPPPADGESRPVPAELAPFFQPPEEYRGELGEYRSPLLFADGTPVTTPEDWQRRRQEILSTWHAIMGPWPPLIERPRVKTVATVRRENLTQHHLKLGIAVDGAMVEGLLLVPDGDGPFPAVLVVYYDAQTGVGLGTKMRDYGWQLAKRGFVTLSLGKPTSRIDFDNAKKVRGGTYFGPEGRPATVEPLSLLAYVAANAHTALAQRGDVIPERIGIVGHSFGGKWALFASCLYDKLACAVWSDPGIVFDERDRRKQNPSGSVNYWDVWYLGFELGEVPDPENLGGFRKLPSEGQARTGAYKRLVEGGHDLVELHALMAPRPFLVSGGTADLPERWPALNHAIAVNKLLGYENRVAMTNRASHGPTEEANDQVCRFFEWWLDSPDTASTKDSLIPREAATMEPGEWRNLAHLTTWPGKADGRTFKEFQYVTSIDGKQPGGADGMGWTQKLVYHQGRLMILLMRDRFQRALMVMEPDGRFWRLNQPEGFDQESHRRPFNKLTKDDKYLYFSPNIGRENLGRMIRTPLDDPGVFESYGIPIGDSQISGEFAATYVPEWGRFYAYTPGGKIWSWAEGESEWTRHGEMPRDRDGHRISGYAGLLLWNPVREELIITGGITFGGKPSTSHKVYRLTERLGDPEMLEDRRYPDGELMPWRSGASKLFYDPRNGDYIVYDRDVFYRNESAGGTYRVYEDVRELKPFGRWEPYAPLAYVPGTDVIVFLSHLEGLVLHRLKALPTGANGE